MGDDVIEIVVVELDLVEDGVVCARLTSPHPRSHDRRNLVDDRIRRPVRKGGLQRLRFDLDGFIERIRGCRRTGVLKKHSHPRWDAHTPLPQRSVVNRRVPSQCQRRVQLIEDLTLLLEGLPYRQVRVRRHGERLAEIGDAAETVGRRLQSRPVQRDECVPGKDIPIGLGLRNGIGRRRQSEIDLVPLQWRHKGSLLLLLRCRRSNEEKRGTGRRDEPCGRRNDRRGIGPDSSACSIRLAPRLKARKI